RTAFQAGKERILALTFSANGKTLATCSGGEVKLWDVPSGKQLGVLTSPDGKPWGVVTGWKAVPNLIAWSQPVLALSPNGRIIATNRVAMLDQEKALKGESVPLDPGANESLNDVKLWDTAGGKEKSTLRGHTGRVHTVVFSPAGESVATVGEDGFVRLWDPTTGKEQARVELADRFAPRVVFSPDSASILTAD